MIKWLKKVFGISHYNANVYCMNCNCINYVSIPKGEKPTKYEHKCCNCGLKDKIVLSMSKIGTERLYIN